MTPEHEEFPELKTLLALKRHETPPPGYFENFSGKVIARIEAQAAAGARPWWRRWLVELDLRPAVACAYSLAIGGMLVVGMSTALDAPTGESAGVPMPTLDQPLLASHPGGETEAGDAPQLTLQPVTLPGDEPSAVGAVLNPDAAPSGFFNTEGMFSRPSGTDAVSPATLKFQR